MIFRWWRWKLFRSPAGWIGIALYLLVATLVMRSPEIKQAWLFTVILITPLIIAGLLLVAFSLLFVSLFLHFQAKALCSRLLGFEVVRVQILQLWCGGTCKSELASPPIGFSGFFGFVSILPREPDNFRRRLIFVELAGIVATILLILLTIVLTDGSEGNFARWWLILFAAFPFYREFAYAGDTALNSKSEPNLMVKSIVDAYTSGYPIISLPDWMFLIAIQPQPHPELRCWAARHYATFLSYNSKYSEAAEAAEILMPSDEAFDKELIGFLNFVLGRSEIGMALATEQYDGETTFYGYVNRAFIAFFAGNPTEAHYRLRDLQNAYVRYEMDFGTDHQNEFAKIGLARKIMDLPAHSVHARNGVLAGGEDAGAKADA